MPATITPVQPEGRSPGGHYSHGIIHNGLVFVSGQLPTVPGAAGHVVGSIEEQTRQAMANVESVLEAAGSDLEHLLSVTIYVSDMNAWSAVNTVYAAVMGECRPARAIVPCGLLHYGYGIEIQAVGVVKAGK